MGRLIDGKWTDSDESYRQGGAFVRATPAFRSFITANGSSPFPPEAGRYHLYVALPCPWCHPHHDFSRPQTASGSGVDQYGRSAHVGRRMEIQGARSNHRRTVRPPTLYIG